MYSNNILNYQEPTTILNACTKKSGNLLNSIHTTLYQSGPESNGNEGILHILQSFKTRASPSNCLVSYKEHELRESYLSLEVQSMYSMIPANPAGK